MKIIPDYATYTLDMLFILLGYKLDSDQHKKWVF